MSDIEVEERNGVAVDNEIASLTAIVEDHLAHASLPNHGLILAYNFPPFSDASAATVAKRIRQFARKVDVVSQDLSAIRSKDADLVELVAEFVDEHFELSGEPGFAAWPAIRNYVLDGYAAVKSSLLNKRYGFIYSRSMFPATHFLAAFIKARHPEVFWISEFSDPVRHDVEGNDRPSQGIPVDYIARNLESGVKGAGIQLLDADRSVLGWCETLGVVVADRTIFTNEHQRDVMLEPYFRVLPAELLLSKAIVSPHPTLGHEYYNLSTSSSFETRADCIDIGYFGEFYPNRGVGELVRAISGLALENRRKFRVHVFTNDVSKALRSLKILPFDTSFVRVKPSKNLFTFLKLAAQMDALYVSDVSIGLGYARNPYLPSKFSDYRGTDVPIIASVWPGSVMSKNDTINRFFIGDLIGLREYLNRLCEG